MSEDDTDRAFEEGQNSMMRAIRLARAERDTLKARLERARLLADKLYHGAEGCAPPCDLCDLRAALASFEATGV